MNQSSSKDSVKNKREAETCIALGAGVGVLGATVAAVTGAVCPLCILIAPGMVGYGLYKKRKDSVQESQGGSDAKK